jgi:deoxyxylulose-5-phosphate synthase
MFDSFEGLPPADDRDGPLALQYQRDTHLRWYHDNCKAPLHKVRDAANRFEFSESEAIIVPGWFSSTLIENKPVLARHGISLLRVDCDWYEPVSTVLNELGCLVSEEGYIVLDDYYAWDGCARAVHDYLSRNRLSWRIRTVGQSVGAWMIKRRCRANYSQV